MEKGIEAQRTMCYSVKDMIAGTPSALLVQMPTINTVFSRFQETLDLMPAVSESQSMDRRGQAIVKEVYKRGMAVAATNISARVKAMAVTSGNTILAQEMSKSYSSLLKAKDTVSADLCDFIRVRADSHLVALEDYGVTAADCDDLKDKVELYVSQLPKPRAGIVERKQATKKIKLMMKSLLSDLRIMDVLVDMLRYSEVAFYDTYYSTRKVIAAHRTLSIQGLVLGEDGLPLEKVDVYLIGSTITRKTSEYGGFEIKNLTNNVYKMRFVKPGYLDVEEDIPVTATMRSEITVKMERDVSLELKVA